MAKQLWKIECSDSPPQYPTSQGAAQPGSMLERLLLRAVVSADPTPVVPRPNDRGELAVWTSSEDPEQPGPSRASEGATERWEQQGPMTPTSPEPRDLQDRCGVTSSERGLMGVSLPANGRPDDIERPGASDDPGEDDASEVLMTSWGDLRDPRVQECFAQLPKEAFQVEMRKLPSDWAQLLRRQRHNFLVRTHQARHRARNQETEHVKEQYESHLLIQNIKWEQALQRAYCEMGEIKANQARTDDKNEGLNRQVHQLHSKNVELNNNCEIANHKLTAALIAIGGHVSENRRLEAENQGLVVKNQSFVDENQRLIVENQSFVAENRRLIVENQSLAVENQWLRDCYDRVRMEQEEIMEAGQEDSAPWQPEAEAAATPEEMALQPLQPEGAAAC